MAKTEVPIPVKVESPAQSHTENPASKSAVSYENMISGLRIELGKQRFCKNPESFGGKKQKKISDLFNANFEIRERCKGVHWVDLGESFPTSIYLQNLASIQPRTSLFNFD